MKTLVTGGLGFLGAALSRALVARGEQVRILDNASRGSKEKLGDAANDVEILEGDIRDPDSVRKAVKGMDRVCHLAFVNGTEFFYEHPAYILDVGVKGMVNVLDACIKEGVKELITASSSEAYQTPPVVPTPENVPLVVPDPLNPRYSYGGGKILYELMTLHYGKECFDRALLFRPHNVYGPDMGWEHVIPQFVTRMKEMSSGVDRLPFPIQGDGSQTRSFIFIDDFTDGLLHMIDKGEHLGIYHIGTMEEVTIKDLAETIGAELQLTITVQPGPQAPGGTQRRCPDIGKLRALGFAPKYSLHGGLQKTVPWYRDHEKPMGSRPPPALFIAD